MNKLKKEQVLIQGEGLQIKALLSESQLNKIAEELNLNIDTINQYLRRKKLPIKFINELRKLYPSIWSKLKKLEEQLETILLEIKEEIEVYEGEEDSEIFEYLMEQTSKIKNQYLFILAKGNYGRFMINRKKTCQAEKILKEVIALSEKNNFHDLAIDYTIEMAYSLYLEKRFKEGLNEIIQVESQVKKICLSERHETCYRFFYFKGILLEALKQHPKARNEFKKAIDFTENQFKIGRAFMNLAISYKNDGHYPSAIKYNEKALDIYKKLNDIEMISIIKNNMANVYFKINEIEKALFLIKSAIDEAPENILLNRKLNMYNSYFEIANFANYDLKNIVESIFSLLREGEKIIQNKFIIQESVELILNNCMIEQKKKLLTIFLELLSKELEEYELEFFKARVGEITLALIERKEVSIK